jgi:hypothetical protein
MPVIVSDPLSLSLNRGAASIDRIETLLDELTLTNPCA